MDWSSGPCYLEATLHNPLTLKSQPKIPSRHIRLLYIFYKHSATQWEGSLSLQIFLKGDTPSGKVIRNTPIMKGGACSWYNLCWPSREQYANFDCSHWTEPGKIPNNAWAVGFNPSIPIFTVSLGPRIVSHLDSQLIKLAEEVSLWISDAWATESQLV